MKKYTSRQIEAARKKFYAMLVTRSVESYEPEYIGWAAAEQRAAFNNDLVEKIKAGDEELTRKWKLFFLDEEFKADKKAAESKAKLAANKAASADVLSPIKSAKRLGEFGKWLNTPDNPFRKQHFNKKYTEQAVESFLSI